MICIQANECEIKTESLYGMVMATLHEVELIEVLSDIPDIQTLDVKSAILI